MTRIGIISDTHGLLRPEIGKVFRGVQHIVHAGDVGGDGIVDELKRIAPVTFVHGNSDGASGVDVERVTVEGLRILVTHILPRPSEPGSHILDELEREPADVVVFGHSHLPHDEVLGGVRWFNPASAGPRRFDYPVSAGVLERTGDGWRATHVALDPRSISALRERMNQLTRG